MATEPSALEQKIARLRQLQANALSGGVNMPSVGSPSLPASAFSEDIKSPGMERMALNESLMNARNRIAGDPAAARAGASQKLIDDLNRIAGGEKPQATSGGVPGAFGKGVAGFLGGVQYAMSRPLALVTSTAKELADIPSGGFSVNEFVSQALARDTAPSKYIAKTGVDWLDKTIGFVADTAADPLTYITFGASQWAGRAGRLNLAAFAAQAENLAKAPSLAPKIADGSIARLGEWALNAAEREALGIRRGLSWSFGGGAKIGREGTALGKLSEGAATVVGKPLANVRGALSETGIFEPLQKVFTPKSAKLSDLTMYGRIADNKTARERIGDLATYSAANRANAVGNFVEKKFGSIGQALVKEISDYEASTGRRIFQVREGMRPAADATEQDLVNRMQKFLNDMREYTNKATAEFGKRRNVNPIDIGYREKYVPYTLTEKAKNFVLNTTSSGRPPSSGANQMLGLTASQFIEGPGILRSRTLKSGDEFLGVKLKTDIGDGIGKVGDPDYLPGSASISEINQISRERLGYDWFEEDGAKYLSSYLDSVVTQAKRVAFTDRLYDYGSDYVKAYTTRILPDKRLVKQINKAINFFDGMVNDVAGRIVGDLGGDLDAALTQRVNIAETIINSRPGDAILTPEQVGAIQSGLDDVVAVIAKADGVAAGLPDEVRAGYDLVVYPLRARMAEIADALETNDQARLASLVGLRDLYQKIFPEADAIPSDPKELAEDIVDAVAAMRGGPDVAETASALADDATRAARGLEIPTEGGMVYATPEEGATAVENLQRLITRRETGLEARNALGAVSAELPGQAAATTARGEVSRLEGEIQDIATSAQSQLEIIAKRREKAEKIINRQRTLFGGDEGLGGRAVPLPEARSGAERFVKNKSRVYEPPPATTTMNPVFQRDIATAYKRMPEGAPNPNTRAGRAAIASYDALKRDIDEQYDYLVNELGIKVEFVPDDPYPNTAEMFIDIQNNKRLRIWSGESDNPMLTNEQNLKFRAVHDYFGHAAVGSRFDRNGEEMAFLHHMQMFSPEARGAAASELRGQNAYMNVYGEFGPQKGYLMPERFWGPNNMVLESIDGLTQYGGYTIDLAGKQARPTSGYQVSLGNDLEVSIPAWEIGTKSDIVDKLFAEFLAKKNVADSLRKTDNYFGTYYSSESDLVYAEVSRNYQSIDEAYEQAVKTRQESILDWANFDSDKSEIRTVDMINAKEQRGAKLTDDEIRARQEIEERVAKNAEERAAREAADAASRGAEGAGGPVTGGTRGYEEVAGGGPVQGSVRPTARDEAGRVGAERLAGLPLTRYTQTESDRILVDGARRLRALGFEDSKFPRSPNGTRVNPIDKEAKNIRVSAQRRTALRQEKAAEAQAVVDAVRPLNLARQEWDDTVGRIYNEDIAAVVKAASERPPEGVAAEVNARWVARTAEVLENLRAPGLDLTPGERDVMERIITTMKGMEAELALYERFRSFSQERLDQAMAGKIGNPKKISDDIVQGWTSMESLGVQMPPEIRDRMFSKVAELGTPKGASTFGKMLDSYTKFFKVSAMFSPGFIVRNAYTAAFNNFVAGVSLAETKAALKFANNIRRYGMDQALNMVPNAERALYEQALKVTYASGAGQSYDDILAPVLAGKGSKLMNSKPVKKWSEANETTEIGFRFALGLSSLKKGMDFDSASTLVSRYHFDYTDLSTADEFMRKFIPFWIFASRNIPLQIVNGIARPSMYRAYESLERNFGLTEEQKQDLPDWMRNRNPLSFPGMPKDAFIMPDLPQLDMQEQIRMMSDPMRLVSQANPVFKLPIELMGDRQLWNAVPFSEKKTPVRGPLDFPAYAIDAILGRGGKNPQTGERYTSSKTAYALPNLLPTLAQLQRLIPELGGKEVYQDRSSSSRASFIGLPYRRVAEGEKFNELTRRQFAIRDYLSELTRRGILRPKEQ